MSEESEVTAAPNWLKELEAKRERRLKVKLGHEAGAGAPCLTCEEKCPGLDLHFWRKICKNCKCSKESHDVPDDDIYSWAQFELLGSKPNKNRKKIVLPGKKDEVELEWAPKGQNETIDQYLQTLPPEALPVKGSQAAQDRKQLLQKQIPVHDIDPNLCHELTGDELQKMEEYIAHMKEKSVGVGQLINLSNVFKGSLHHFNPSEAAIIASRFAKGLPTSEIVKLQAYAHANALKSEQQNFGISSDLEQLQLSDTNQELKPNLLPHYSQGSYKIYEDKQNPIGGRIKDISYVQKLGSDGEILNNQAKYAAGIQKSGVQGQNSGYLGSQGINQLPYNPDVINSDKPNQQLLTGDELPYNLRNYAGGIQNPELNPGNYGLGINQNSYLANDPNQQLINSDGLARNYPNYASGINKNSGLDQNSGLPLLNQGNYGVGINQNSFLTNDPNRQLINSDGLARNHPNYAGGINKNSGSGNYGSENIQNSYLPNDPNQQTISSDGLPKNHPNYAGGINKNSENYPGNYGLGINQNPNENRFNPYLPNDPSGNLPNQTGGINKNSGDAQGINQNPNNYYQNPYNPNNNKLSQMQPSTNIHQSEDILQPYQIQIGAIHDINYPEQNEIHYENPPQKLDLNEILSSVILPNCKYCKKAFTKNEFAMTIDRSDALYHPDCFKCAGCNQKLADDFYFYHEENDSIYCGRDYAKIRGIPRCNACDELIFTKNYCLAQEATFHLKHFCCYNCDIPLAGQNYLLEDSVPFCLPCFEEKKAEKCNGCLKVIKPEEQGLTLNGMHFHATDGCFCCNVCRLSLFEKKLLLRNEKLYCSHDCFGKDQ